MKKLLFLLVAAQLCRAELYITVTSSAVKRAKMAVGQVYPLEGGQVDATLARKAREQLLSDLEFAGLFEFAPDISFQSYDRRGELHQVNYDGLEAANIAFILKLGYRKESEKLVIEAVLHDVAGKKKIFGTRYQYPASQYARLVHAIAEDILKQLTGERGLFMSRIAMVCWDKKGRSPDKEVFIVNPDGSNLIKLTSDKTLSLSPAWSPDGKTLAYTQFDWRVADGIRKKGMVLKRHELASGSRKILSARDGMNSGAAWMPNGKKLIATLSFNGRPELYFIDPSGGGEPEPLSRGIKWTRIGGGMQTGNDNLLFEVEGSFSPDSSKMVFSSRRTGNPMIYTLDLATKMATQLTFAGQYNATPAWSPKGDKIIFAAQRTGEGNFDLYAIDPDGNNLARVTNGERPGRRVNSENPSWAPTGRHIAFANNDGGAYGVYVMAVDGSAKRKISPENKECKSPAWGPSELN